MTMVELSTTNPVSQPCDTDERGSTMQQSRSTVTTLPTRVPPPGDPAVTRYYEAQKQDDKWHAADASEQNALAHLRGWTHFGPACPICFPGRAS